MSRKPWQWTLLLVSALLVIGCAELRLVSEYDEFTDQTLTGLQRRVETLLTGLERKQAPPACLHASHDEAYAAMSVELNLLMARNSIRPKNDITNRQLAILADSIAIMETLHRDSGERCLTAFDIAALRPAFESSFTAILKLELAKKRGEIEDD